VTLPDKRRKHRRRVGGGEAVTILGHFLRLPPNRRLRDAGVCHHSRQVLGREGGGDRRIPPGQRARANARGAHVETHAVRTDVRVRLHRPLKDDVRPIGRRRQGVAHEV